MANPTYRQVAEDLRQQIESGKFASGSHLPTELELREHYSALPKTVQDAIKWLTTLGLVETRPGQGTFVIEAIDPFVTTLSDNPALGGGEGAIHPSEVNAEHRTAADSPVQVEIQQATGEVAARLRIPADAAVISRHQKRYIDDTPWSLQTSFNPIELANRGAELLRSASNIGQGAVQYLLDTVGLRQVGYRDWITVCAPHTTGGEFFKLPLAGRVAIYEVFRTAFDQTSTSMRLTVTAFPTDRNQFIVNVGEVPTP
jgi:GntR family transcriptional regulator